MGICGRGSCHHPYTLIKLDSTLNLLNISNQHLLSPLYPRHYVISICEYHGPCSLGLRAYCVHAGRKDTDIHTSNSSIRQLQLVLQICDGVFFISTENYKAKSISFSVTMSAFMFMAQAFLSLRMNQYPDTFSFIFPVYFIFHSSVSLKFVFRYCLLLLTPLQLIKNQGPCDHCSEEPEQAGDAGELKEYFLLR